MRINCQNIEWTGKDGTVSEGTVEASMLGLRPGEFPNELLIELYVPGKGNQKYMFYRRQLLGYAADAVGYNYDTRPAFFTLLIIND